MRLRPNLPVTKHVHVKILLTNVSFRQKSMLLKWSDELAHVAFLKITWGSPRLVETPLSLLAYVVSEIAEGNEIMAETLMASK